jgi:hypothetical protein
MYDSKKINEKIFLEDPLRSLILNYDYSKNLENEAPWEVIDSEADFNFYLKRIYDGYDGSQYSLIPIAVLHSRGEVIFLANLDKYMVLEYDTEEAFDPKMKKINIGNTSLYSLDSVWKRVLFDIEMCKK